MELGIKDIILISTSHQIIQFQQLLGDGANFGITLNYVVQPSPDGLAQAFLLCEKQIIGENCCLILGDNVFHNTNLNDQARLQFEADKGCRIFLYKVSDPERYGIANFKGGVLHSIEEKPKNPISNLAITGLYFFDNTVVDRAKLIKPSERGELEITDLINAYRYDNSCSYEDISNGAAWLDTGTFSSLIAASNYVQMLEKRQGTLFGAPEKVAFEKGYISETKYQKLIGLYNTK